MRKLFRISVFFFTIFSLFFAAARITPAKADTLVIEDDGAIKLILDEGVLGLSADTLKIPTVRAKEIELVPPREESKVKIEPSHKDNKKVEVTITPKSVSKTAASNPPSPIKKEVEQVIAKGKSGQAVLTVSPTNADTLSIQQGNAKASTNLPVQVDSVNHSMSVVTAQGKEEKLSVLPKAAIDNVTQNGLFNPTATLSVNQAGPVYSINGQRKVNVLNVFKFNLPVTVSMSAQSGRTLNTSFRVWDLFLGR